MGCFVVKIIGNNEHWFKLEDQIDNEDYEGINLDDAIDYDPNNNVTDQWFKINAFNEKEGFVPMLDTDFDVAELDSITRDQFSQFQIDFIAYYHNHRYYMQNFTRGNYLRKKWFSWNGEAVTYKEEDGLVFVNPIPNCIYDNQTHCIYFMDIVKAYAIFKCLKLDYKAATDEETDQMLQSDIIQTEGGFNVTKVGVSNRKRITSILAKFNQYEPDMKNTLRAYIREKVGTNLRYDEETGKFMVSSDTQLRLLLFGIQQRLYQPPLEEEVQVATATTSLSRIME